MKLSFEPFHELSISNPVFRKELEGALDDGDVGLADLGNLLRRKAGNQIMEVRFVLMRLCDSSLRLQ